MAQSIAIIAPSSVPFQLGGAEKFWWGLRDALSKKPGILAELIKLPSPEGNFRQILHSYRQFAELDLSHFDMVISTKYPAWMARHANHVLYMQHTLRGLYDTYHFTGLPEKLDPIPGKLQSLVALARKSNPTREDLATMFELCDRGLADKTLPSALFAFPGPLIREIVHFFDRVALAPDQIAAYLAISRTVRERKDYFPANVAVKVLHHPTDMAAETCRQGEYIFTASRINGTKRIGLIVKAMRHVKADVPLRIAGTGPDLEELRKYAAADPRIEFLGHVPDAALPGLYAGSLFVPFAPYQEDYGLITIEAMNSGKPVLTTTDAGGVCEMVRHGENGLCVEPTPIALGEAIQKLLDNPPLMQKMGQAAKRSVAHIRWPEVVDALLLHAAQGRQPNGESAVVVCSTYPADRHGSGGQRRLYHYCAALAQKFSVRLLVFFDGAVVESGEILPNFWELRIPKPRKVLEDAERLKAETGISLDDVAIMRSSGELRAYVDALASQASTASCVVAAHPYLFPLIRQICKGLPLIYDAHNVEYDLKKSFAAIAPAILAEIKDVESQCCHAASAVSCCSQNDIERFAGLYGIDPKICHVFANGYDSDSIVFADTRTRGRLRQDLAYPQAKLALFTGSGHYPNILAVEEIIKFAAGLGDMEFLIAGSVCKPFINTLLPENVHLLGVVSEQVKIVLLQAANIGLNPMSGGAGTNLKMIEYVASGLESVSTPFGMRGLPEEFSPLAHICELADFPMEIRKAISRPAVAHTAMSAAQYAARHYSWREIMKSLPILASGIAAQTTANSRHEQV